MNYQKCDHVHFNLLSIALLNQYIFLHTHAKRAISADTQLLSILRELSERCQHLFVSYIKCI